MARYRGHQQDLN